MSVYKAALSSLVLAAVVNAPLSMASENLSLSLDNDLFAPTRTDRDYTAGAAIKYAVDSGPVSWAGYDGALAWLDGQATRGTLPLNASVNSAIEVGFYGFTPEEIEASAVIVSDRPYSSLVYASAIRSYNLPDHSGAWSSSLTVGVLGLDVFKGAQNAVHRVVGSEKARGWRHQISDGGELTGRYSLAYHDYSVLNAPDTKLKLTYFGSLGYLTEAGVALTFRDGLISSPDNRFNPELVSYGERSTDTAVGRSNESYFWGGLSLKVRPYNVFLEGQFRDSDHTIDHSDIRYFLAEAWLGYTRSIGENLKLSYVGRIQSSEINGGQGDRVQAWGGFVVSRTL